MILNNKYNFLYLKQRRTSSTSLEIALSRFCSTDDIITKINRINSGTLVDSEGPSSQNYLDPDQPYFYGLYVKHNLNHCLHHNVKQLIKLLPFSRMLFEYKDPPRLQKWMFKKENQKYFGHMPVVLVRQRIGDERFNDAFKFTVVRNPFDQILSWYYWISATGGKNLQMDFQTFVRKKSLEFFKSNKVVFVEDNKSMVDEILHYESLNQELPRISKRLGLSQNLGEIYSKIKTNSFARTTRGYELIDKQSQEVIINNAEYFFKNCGYSKDVPNQ